MHQGVKWRRAPERRPGCVPAVVFWKGNNQSTVFGLPFAARGNAGTHGRAACSRCQAPHGRVLVQCPGMRVPGAKPCPWGSPARTAAPHNVLGPLGCSQRQPNDRGKCPQVPSARKGGVPQQRGATATECSPPQTPARDQDTARRIASTTPEQQDQRQPRWMSGGEQRDTEHATTPPCPPGLHLAPPETDPAEPPRPFGGGFAEHPPEPRAHPGTDSPRGP